MTLAEAVAKRTKDLLFKHNMSQYKLIKETCLDKTTIQSLFKNKTRDVKFSTIFLIASVFDMTVSEFFDCDYFNADNIEI